MNLNKVHIIGRITRDIDLKALPSGVKVGSFSIATNRVYMDQNKEKKETTEFHNIVAFGKQAETLAQYTGKGAELYVEGRLQTRSWETDDGKKMYRTEIVIENFQFGQKAGSSQGGSTTSRPSRPAKKQTSHEEGETVEYPEDDINAEDIPF